MVPKGGDPSASTKTVFGVAAGAWPDLSVPEDAFAAYVAERAGEGDVAQMYLRDLYLACACARRDPKAIALFDREFLSPLAAIVARAGSPEHVGVEVTQILREKLLVGDGDRGPQIVEYSGRGSMAGWLRIAAVRTASKVCRHERVHAGLRSEEPFPAASPEEETIRARYADLFNEAFRAAFRALPPDERLLLRLHFAEGLNLHGLAVALRFSRATAGRRIIAARTRLRDETMRLLGEQLSASPEEVNSVLAALRSRLEITFGQLVSAA